MTSSKATVAAPVPVEDADILAEFLPVDAQIQHFLAGNTTGRALLEALYDEVLAENVPERLTELMRRR